MTKVKLTAGEREAKRAEQRLKLAQATAELRRAAISRLILGHVAINTIAKTCNDPVETVLNIETFTSDRLNPFAVAAPLPPEKARELVPLWLTPSELEWSRWPVKPLDDLLVPEVTYDLIDALKAVVIAEHC